MPTHWGNEGVVKVGNAAVVNIVDWKFDRSVTPVKDTVMGSPWETHIPGSGIKSWKGDITCRWTEDDLTGQEALTIGASVTLNLYPEGASSSDKYYSGLVSITNVGIDVKMDADTIQRTYSFEGNGACNDQTVP